MFLKRNVGFEGDIATSLDALTVDDPQMVFRKQFLRNWVSKVGSRCDFPQGKVLTYSSTCAQILTADFDDPVSLVGCLLGGSSMLVRSDLV